MTVELRRCGLGKYPGTIITSNVFALIFATVIVLLCFRLSQDAPSAYVNLLVSLLGALAGWIIGIFASPYSKTESERFITLAQAISAFVSGYVISKLDRFFEDALFTDTDLEPTAWLRLGLFSAACLLAATIVFLNRHYFGPRTEDGNPPVFSGRQK